jgi:hypothetical protein
MYSRETARAQYNEQHQDTEQTNRLLHGLLLLRFVETHESNTTEAACCGHGDPFPDGFLKPYITCPAPASSLPVGRQIQGGGHVVALGPLQPREAAWRADTFVSASNVDEGHVTIHLPSSVLMLSLAVASVSAQAPVMQARGWPLLTSQELVSLIGSEADAAVAIPKALAEFFRRPRNSSPRVVLIGAQIRPEWVPSVPGIEFVLLSNDEAQRWPACSSYGYIYGARGTPDLIEITVGQRNRCRGSGTAYRINRTTREFETGVGSGFGSAVGHCGCG